MLIGDIYHPNPITISNRFTVKDALKLCIQKKVNGLVVLNEKDKVVGVVSIQDIAAATVPHEFQNNIGMAAAMYKRGFFHEMCQQLQDKPVTTVMRKKFETVNLRDNILAITAEFLKGDLYIVPVIEKGEFIGVVTRSEIKRALAVGMGLLHESQVKHT